MSYTNGYTIRKGNYVTCDIYVYADSKRARF